MVIGLELDTMAGPARVSTGLAPEFGESTRCALGPPRGASWDQHVAMPSRSARVRFAADYPTGAIRPLHRRGELTRLRRGAYIPADAEVDITSLIMDRCVAVARQLKVRFAFSHETAVLLHELPESLSRTDAVHLVQESRPAGSSASDLIRHVVTELRASDITEVHDLPVTTLERTCVDCVRVSSPAQGLAVADAVLRKLSGTTRFNWPETAQREREIRDRLLNQVSELAPARGVVRARAVLAYAQGRAESPAESRLRWLVLTEGFVEPDLQVAVRTAQGTYYPDMLWSGADVLSGWRSVALEYDGVAKYQESQDLYDEKVREDALRAAGCHVIRATKADLRDPRSLVRTLTKHVAVESQASPERRGLRIPR